MPLENSQQVIIDFRDWLDSIIQPKRIKSDSNEPIQKPKSVQKVVYDDDEE